jgi:uncharacterized protein
MSELINNRTQQREALKDIIRRLHDGEDAAGLKDQFRGLLDDVGATEIAELESELISAGLPEEEVKRLCDVHVAVFEDALSRQAAPETMPGHPIHTFRLENRATEAILGQMREAIGQARAAGNRAQETAALERLRGEWAQLRQAELHYLRKENLLFPYLEKYGIKGPSSVMWALHDDVRAIWKSLSPRLEAAGSLADLGDILKDQLPALLETMGSMVYKEENILFPMALERLSREEWLEIERQSPEIGFAWVQPGDEWPIDLERLTAEGERGPALTEAPAETAPGGRIPLDTGALSLDELNLMLTHLPLDITFVDKDDIVRYFSAGKERIFIRTGTVIGRNVQNCHPPKSVHVVEQILADFKSGRRDQADFWIQMGPKFVFIRYYAVRDAAGEYVGALEVTQDIAPLRALEGEQRLLSGQ